MPDIRPFRGVLYNPQKIKDIASVVAEPYDVINPRQQAAYYRRHPYNIIRLILGKRYSNDNSKNNQYTRANRLFTDWQKENILLRDKKQSIYIYTQTFPYNGRKKTRTGFIVLLKLEDFGKNTILPHENTFSHPVQDRLNLLKIMGANSSPIFAMFSDPQKKVSKLLIQHKRKHRPDIVIKKDNILHKLWRMSDKVKIASIKKLLSGRQAFIADGHHRYEAALNYKLQMQKRKKSASKGGSFNYVMTYLVATADSGLAILATHRVLKIKARFRPQELVRKLRKLFEIRKFSTSEKVFSYMHNAGSERVLGAYFGKNRFYGLKLKHPGIACKFTGKDRQGLRKELDVTILHSLIIEQALNMGSGDETIYYTRDAQEAIKLVKEGAYHAALFLKPTTIRQVKRVASSGAKMPHKSTYFYPKLLTGLVINKL